MPTVFFSYGFEDGNGVQGRRRRRDSHREEFELLMQVSYWLGVQKVDTFVWHRDGDDGPSWSEQLGPALARSGGFVFFLGEAVGRTQKRELEEAHNRGLPTVFVGLHNQNVRTMRQATAPIGPRRDGRQLISVSSLDDPRALAEQTVKTLAQEGMQGVAWHCDDGLPLPREVGNEGGRAILPVSYEQDIISLFLKDWTDPRTKLGALLLSSGFPPRWPKIAQRAGGLENPINLRDLGFRQHDPAENGGGNGRNGKSSRNGDRYVLSATLSRFPSAHLESRRLVFSEAGPRPKLAFPTPEDEGRLDVGILVSGGIAPGINAVIAGIVERHCSYADASDDTRQLTIWGYQNGFSDLAAERGTGRKPMKLSMEAKRRNVPIPGLAAVATEGGSILGTSRLPDFANLTPAARHAALQQVVNNVWNDGVRILYVIGGDGSMRAAHALWNTARALNVPLSVVGVPKAMDNDVLWVWTSFGFQSAVQQSTEAVRQLWTEASSNPRLCVVQLFGADSGFVVTDAAAASGKCDLFLVPEKPFDMKTIADHLARKLVSNERAHAVVVMAETAVPTDILEYVGDPGSRTIPEERRTLLREIGLTNAERDQLKIYAKTRRVLGPTPDALRSGALKVVSRVLWWRMKKATGLRELRVFTNEPRHLIRAVPPSSSDIIFARRLAYLAVDGAMAGFEDFMISQWLTEYVMVPLSLVVLGRKRIPVNGAFYANARASTGQPSDLDVGRGASRAAAAPVPAIMGKSIRRRSRARGALPA